VKLLVASQGDSEWTAPHDVVVEVPVDDVVVVLVPTCL
jgi:hypothetical protein